MAICGRVYVLYIDKVLAGSLLSDEIGRERLEGVIFLNDFQVFDVRNSKDINQWKLFFSLMCILFL